MRSLNSGFTLIEALIVLVVVGILAAISAPSFITWKQRTEFNDSVTKIRVAMEITQRESIRRSKGCTLSIPEGNSPTLISTCMLLDNTSLKNVTIDNQGIIGTLDLQYTFKGTLSLPSGLSERYVLISAINGNKTKCIANNLIGTTRVGNWNGSNCLGDTNL